MCFVFFFDAAQGVMGCIIRGMGKANYATYGVAIGYYAISVPLAVTFAFRMDYGIEGLWWGVVCGQTTICIFYQYLISWKFDWRNLVLEALERSSKEKIVKKIEEKDTE